MSGIYTRATRQRSKPVILDLRKTDVGYEVFDDKYTNPIPNPKPIIQRPEKPLNYSKTLNPKMMDKGGVSPSNSANLSDSMSRSKTMVRPPMQNAPKINIQNGMPMQERNPLGRTGDFAIKEEIYPFNSLPMSSGRMGQMGKPLGADLNLSSQFEKPLGPSYGHSMQPPEGGYPKPVERIQKRYPVIIPSAAQWFEMDGIHQIEKEYMPEYFLGKPTKTPEVYKRYRNFIINLYRQSPSNYLNATTCRKHLAGDACSIMRLHSFLEHWGLINFHIDPAGYPKNLFLNKSNCTSEKLLELSNNNLRMDIIEQAVMNNLPNTETDTLIRQIKTMTKSCRPLCGFCGMGCGSVWYLQRSTDQTPVVNPEQALQGPQSVPQDNGVKKPSDERRLILCIECYNKGNIPGVLTEFDFDKVDLLRNLDSETMRSQALGSWSQEENYRLLDLIQKHGDNWTEIQKSFPYKSKEDLVACYLRMPIEKVTSINILEMGEYRGHEDNPDDRVVDHTPTVFGDYSNPILQHAAIFRSLLAKHREQKALKKKALQQAAAATAAAASEDAKEAKIEERSDVEITKISDKAKEEEPSSAQGVAAPIKVENGEVLSVDKDIEMGEAEIKEEMEEEKEVPKTAHDISKEVANKLVQIQVSKLEAEVDFLEEYEKILVHERKQYDVLQQALMAEKVEVAHKRTEFLKQYQPAVQSFPEQVPIETSYFDFGAGGHFNTDDMLDIGEGFPKDSF